MKPEFFLAVVIVLLLGYIIYLNIKLAKKTLFIESTVRRLSGIEKNWSTDEMMKFLQEIRKISHYSSFFTDKLFDEQPLGFLLEDEMNSKIFIHYTREEEDAMNIIREGFRFADSFYKTALPVTHDRLDLLMKHNSRKSFGDYLIILSISEKIFSLYSSEIDKFGLKGFSVENILTEVPPYYNENGDLIYLLPNKFVKGMINHKTGEIISNPEYNPMYNSPLFGRNIDQMKAGAGSCKSSS
ncbi:MAG: hypothetical protein ABSG89_07495 [Bacteroidales bacterium]|jgi:hypothetical protein